MQINSTIEQGTLEKEYKKVHVNILLTASWLNLQATQSLKSFHISPQQFNILNILRSFHPAPVTVKVLTERMIDQMSNASRLVEKLKTKGLVEREACDEDRRRVNVYITEAGLALLEKANIAFETNLSKNFEHLSLEEITWVNNTLEQLRG